MSAIELQKLDEACKNSFFENFKRCFSSEKVSIDEFQEVFEKSKILTNRMAVVLLTGNEATIHIKTYYNYRDLTPIIKSKFKKINDEASTIDDFVKEFTNLMGGKLRAMSANVNLNMFMGTPFSSTGFDDIFLTMSDSKGGNKWRKAWVIEYSNAKFYCSAEVNSKDLDKIMAFEKLEWELEGQEDEIDFL